MENASLLEIRLDYIWILLSAALVFMMQAGFMCLESGLASAKNSINIAIKNLADFIVSAILFWAVGFGLMFGLTMGGWAGGSDFLLSMNDPWTALLFVFEVVFAGTAATIVSGAISGRTKFGGYLIISAVISGVIYPVFGHWAWGGLLHNEPGWLQALGFKDFAGSTVVHSVGAWTALAAIIVIGPRIGRFDKDGAPRPIPPHNMTFAYLGGFILLFGWFGFNCGSTLHASDQVGQIAFNTLLGGSFGCLSASTLSWIFSPLRRPQGEMIINGLLGGLVGVTAGCAYMGEIGAIATGFISGIIVFVGCRLMDFLFRLDDVVGAIPVHGFCGAWGTLAVGLFIRPDYLEGATRTHQVLVQLLGISVCFAWTFGLGFLLLKSIDRISGGLRVSKEAELLGLNVSEHGASSSLNDICHALRRATETGDFSDTVKIEVEVGTEMGDLARGFNRMVEAVQMAILESRRQLMAAHEAQQAAEGATNALQSGREAHRASIQKIGRSLSQMMSETEATLTRIFDTTTRVRDDVSDFTRRSAEINKALEIIRSISFSINLLTVNAAIEAARAGESGNGFSVVAEDMNRLNRQTQEAAGRIAGMTETFEECIQKTLDGVEAQYESVMEGKDKILRAGKLVRELLEDRQEAVLFS